MLKKMTAGLLAAAIMTVPAFAYTDTQQNTADALNHLDLFLGTNQGYELDSKLTRAQGVTLLVRMLGAEETAQEGSYDHPFDDVDAWADGYVGYAWEHGLTNGVAETKFGGSQELSEQMYLTLVLRALGYSDQGEQPAFIWSDPYEMAHQAGLIASETPDAAFDRGSAVEIFWNALGAEKADTGKTLADTLMEDEVFTEEAFAQAKAIQNGEEYGEDEPSGGNTSGGGSSSGSDSSSGGNTSGGNTSGDNTSGGSSGGGEQEDSASNPDPITWEEYWAMDVYGRQDYFLSFESASDFYEWYYSAYDAYQAEHADDPVNDSSGGIDMGELLGDDT